MELRSHLGQLHRLLEDEDPILVRLVTESWLTAQELETGLRALDPVLITEVGFFDSIRKIAKTHGKSVSKSACPKGQKMVFGVCREVGKSSEKPPKDFFTAAKQIATTGAVNTPSKRVPSRPPRRGEDDSHMPPAWHREKAAFHAQQSTSHKAKAKASWKGDPRSAAHHVLQAIEHDVRSQHYAQNAELSPDERQHARSANMPPVPTP